jgi:hypothetical protein
LGQRVLLYDVVERKVTEILLSEILLDGTGYPIERTAPSNPAALKGSTM